MSYLFVFRTSPDVDHIAPLAWKLLEEGHEVHGVVSPGYDASGDYRIGLLRNYPRFVLHETRPPGARRGGLRERLRNLAAHVRCSLPYALTLLATKRVRCVGVEWGYGLPPAYDRPFSGRGAVAVLRSLARSFGDGRADPHQVRGSFIAAARLLGVPTVCLPHGLNVKLDAATSDEAAARLAEGPLDWSDRNSFSVVVLNTEHQRKWHIEHAMGDPAVMKTWGSLRWSPEWFEMNRRLAPRFDWPESSDRLRVVYMAPKWRNLVHADEAAELLRRIQELDFVSVAVMGHPRVNAGERPKDGSTDPLRDHPDIDWSHIHDVTGVNSVSLIEAADVVVDIGSSIGLEVIMQGKVLINPTYIHDLTTFFDTVEGAAVTAHSADEVTAYLRSHADGAQHQVERSAYDELMRHAVYGSRGAPFDVLGEYAMNMQALATHKAPVLETAPPRETAQAHG